MSIESDGDNSKAVGSSYMTSHSTPEVSVLMPVYNGMPYLPESVESVIGQSFEDWELILVNDGSTDGTESYLESILDARVKVIHLDQNVGLTGALNIGLKKCIGRYTARMDGDDICFPERLENQYRFLEENQDVVLVGGLFQPIGTKKIGRNVDLPANSAEIIDALLNRQHALCHPTTMFRTEVVKKLGGYWMLPLGEEIDLFLRIAEHGKLSNIPEPLIYYRVHEASLNGQRLREMHNHFAYAIYCAKQRKENESPIDYAAFLRRYEDRPIFEKVLDSMDFYALSQYQTARISLLAGNQFRGILRSIYAAACSPRLTMNRLGRMCS